MTPQHKRPPLKDEALEVSSQHEARASNGTPCRFSELSTAGKVLVSAMRNVQFGRFEDLHVQSGEPVFYPPPRLTKVKRIGSAEEPNVRASDDWFLKQPIVDLLREIAAIRNGTVTRLEFRRGQPCLLEWAIPPTLDNDGGGQGKRS